MFFLRKRIASLHLNMFPLYILHIFNDGFQASYLLLLPFIAKDLHINLTQVGLLGTVLNSLSVLFAIPAGYFATKFSGMKIILVAFFIYTVGFLLTGFVSSYLLFLFLFSVSGIGYGMFHPIGFSLIARSSTKEKRGKDMGNFTAIGDLGRIGIAALLTYVITLKGWRFTSVTYGFVACCIALLFSVVFLKKNKTIQPRDFAKEETKVWYVFKNKLFLFATATSIFDAFASSSLFIFLPFLLLKRGISPAFLGSFTGVFFVGNLFGKTLLGRFSDRYKNTIVFIYSELLMALFIFFLANTTVSFLIIICSFILGVFTKGTVPIIQTMVFEAAESHGHVEKSFGVNAMAASFAITVAPLFLGYISDKLGIIVALDIMAIAAILAIFPAITFHQIRKRLQ